MEIIIIPISILDGYSGNSAITSFIMGHMVFAMATIIIIIITKILKLLDK